MSVRPNRPFLAGALLAVAAAFALAAPALAQDASPKVSWHWHQHQPIYWNDQLRFGGLDRYEYAWESIQQTDGGAAHPANDLRDIFGKDDRVAAYQWRMRDSLGSIGGGHPNSGASVSYSGALMENIHSLGQANQLGYSPGWSGAIAQARGWTTTDGKPRLDLVNFAFHHSLTGLHDPETTYMEIRLFQEKLREVLGPGASSRGFFPTEMTFSTRLIPTLDRLGIEWAIVSGEHIARACPDFPLVLGSGGVNCAPPNRADQINPNGGEFVRATISRGCSPVNANPLSYQPAYAKRIDPETGEETRVIVVPADQSQSWLDGFQCIDAGFLDALAARNDPAQPSLALLAHDGDNAFGGGASYYNECVPGLAGDAASRGGEVTSVEQYLADFPPDPANVVHVEDGGWVNADSDFGSPSFINWNYPLITPQGQPDPANGWHEKPRDMAIFTAALNRILTAEQLAPGYERDFAAILHPGAGTHPIDRAWHYYLGSLDSGNVYFGPALDLEAKATIGCNEAVEHVDPLLADLSNDQTPPTIWLPQRFPYNPGSLNYGVEFGYQQVIDDGDFHVWTFIADPSGPAAATLKYRIDADGANPLASNQNETFAGGPEVGEWVSLPMNRRAFPKGQPLGYNNGAIDFFELPAHIADHYSVEVAGLRDVLIDYYVEATDARGNVAKSPIQHVYVGTGEGATGGGGEVTVSPDPPVKGRPVTISYDAAGRVLDGAGQVRVHLGKNFWSEVVSPDPAMTPSGPNRWEYAYDVAPDADTIDCVFNNGAGVWDNNDGQDWHFSVADMPLDEPWLSLSAATIQAAVREGEALPPGSFTVANAGAGQLDYSILAQDANVGPLPDIQEVENALLGLAEPGPALDATGDGFVNVGDLVALTNGLGAASWLEILPAAGSSSGEADAIAIHYLTEGLEPRQYEAFVRVSANASNSPQTVRVVLDVASATPAQTTVEPNPPVGGQSVRVWYVQGGGPLDGEASVGLHWGVNGGLAVGQSQWENVVDEPMAPFDGEPGLWFADILAPAGASTLNFVTNNGAANPTAWDNNGGQDWNFAVAAPSARR